MGRFSFFMSKRALDTRLLAEATVDLIVSSLASRYSRTSMNDLVAWCNPVGKKAVDPERRPVI